MDVECCINSAVENLKALGYDGILLEEGRLKTSLSKRLSSSELVEVFVAVCSELKSLCSLSESLRTPSGPEDEETFVLELRALLRELNCLREDLSTPAVLKTENGLLNCLDFLLSELLAARLQSARVQAGHEFPLLPRDQVGRNLALIIRAYGLSVPPPTLPTKSVMMKLIEKVKESLSGLSEPAKQELMAAMLTTPLSEEEWSSVSVVNDQLLKDYSLRREMMLKRADVTIQSFAWSSRVKDQAGLLNQNKDNMAAKAPVSLSRLLAARQDLLVVRTKDAMPQLRSDLNQVLIGKVPDRGGRPLETRPPPEMPSFKARVEAPKEKRDWSGHGGQRGRGQKGSRVQGGWSPSNNSRGGGRGGQGGGRGGYNQEFNQQAPSYHSHDYQEQQGTSWDQRGYSTHPQQHQGYQQQQQQYQQVYQEPQGHRPHRGGVGYEGQGNFGSRNYGHPRGGGRGGGGYYGPQ